MKRLESVKLVQFLLYEQQEFRVTIPRQSRGHSGCEPLKAAVRGR